MTKICTLAAAAILGLVACTAPNPATGASPSPGASVAPAATTSPVASTGTAPFGLRFLVDGKATSQGDKVAVGTFTDSKVAVTFGQSVGLGAGDYVLTLTFSLNKEKAASGSFDRSAVVSYEALMRENTSGPTYTARSLNPTQLAAANFTLSVADGLISLNYTGDLGQAGGEGKRSVEASVTGLPKDKK